MVLTRTVLALIVAWAAVLAAAMWWLLSLRPEPAPGPVRAPDPYAQEAAEFRRELSDWDRAGRPGSE